MTANTTNGLPYPTGTDAVGNLDTIIQSLAEAIDAKVLAAWSTWTPTLIGATTNPNLGATGGVTGRYLQRGHTVDFQVKFKWLGAGANVGNGNWSFVLPVAPADAERSAFVGIMQAPNRQFVARATAGTSVAPYKVNGTSIYGSTEATADAVGAGTILSFNGTYQV
jgi:hypothetical protein